MTRPCVFPAWGIGGFLFVTLVPLISGTSFSAVFVLGCSLMVGVACYVCADRRNKDPFEIIKLTAALYAAVYGVAPLILGFDGGDGGVASLTPRLRLLESAIAVAVVGQVALVSGYFLVLPGGRSRPERRQTQPIAYSSTTLTKYAITIGFVGLASYIVLIVSAGGVSHLLHYTGNRGYIFSGAFGGFYWGCFFLLAGYALLTAARCHKSRRGLLLLGLALSLMLLVFQGRSLAIAPLFCLVCVYSYRVKRIPGQLIILFAVSAVIASAFLGLIREADKEAVYGDVMAFAEYFVANIGTYVLMTISLNIEQLDVVALVQSYINMGGEYLYGLSLLQWLEPIDRLVFRDSLLPSVHVGNYLLHLDGTKYRPGEGALSPSFVAELYVNGGLLLVIAGLFLWGRFLRWMYRPMESARATPIYLALYSYVSWVAVTTVVDGSVLWFKAVAFSTPLIALSLILPRRTYCMHQTETKPRRK